MPYLIRFVCISCLICSFLSCERGDHAVPSLPSDSTTADSIKMYSWENERTKMLHSTDMVLLYGGGHHRDPYRWSQQRLKPYVVYTDAEQNSFWLFDSFLFLEIMDKGTGGTDKMFVNGYGLESANQDNWNNLIEYFFQSDTGIGALDKCIQEEASVLGNPDKKRQIVIGIPEPIVYQNPTKTSSSTVYWGELDNTKLDFSMAEDKVKACKWYIDRVRAKFDEMQYKNVDLAGFYWIAEKATDTRSILKSIANYLNKFNYSFNWIPYYGADGYDQWEAFGFNEVYFQPNYFFNESIPYSRLEDACQKADQYNMDLELEFDDNVLSDRGKAYRLTNYMNAYKAYGVWENRKLTYYQGSASLLALKNSTNQNDIDMYHNFCDFVISRPIRTSQ